VSVCGDRSVRSMHDHRASSDALLFFSQFF
jgi:hypothetical protein